MVEVTAQIVASVAAVVVAPGERVAQGATLLVVESMKMEIPVVAPLGATVAAVCVAVDDVVAEGDVLVVLDPGPAQG